MAESAYLPGLAIRGLDRTGLARHPALVRITHWITAFSFIGLLVSGVAILLAHPRLYWGETGAVGTPSLFDLPLPFVLVLQSGWGRSLHFLSAWISVLTGLSYVLFGVLTPHFRKNLIPAKADLAWCPVARALGMHLRRKRPDEGQSLSYNVLQRLAYSTVVFLLFPLVVWTGLAMSPSVTSVFPALVNSLGGQQSARTIHFGVSALLVLFLLVHIVMVYLAGFASRTRAMIAPLSLEPVTRRELITAGLATASGAAGLVVAGRLADRYGLIPPDHGSIYGIGETLTYASQRILMSRHPLAREFGRSDISKVAPVNGGAPDSESYRRLLADGFADWRLVVDGLAARPYAFSLAELKQFPSRTQICHQACEEGWSFIAEWTGVPLSYILNLVGVSPRANYVVFFPLDLNSGKRLWSSLDMADARHPQTLLAYGMNGEEIPADHGAPVRLRVARQLGYKNVKYLARITVVDDLKKIGNGLGSSSVDVGYSWYAGI